MLMVVFLLMNRFLIPFHNGSDGKEPACNAGDPRLIPGSGRSSGERSDNPVQYSCLENSIERGARQATVYGVARLKHHQAIIIHAYGLNLTSPFTCCVLLNKFYNQGTTERLTLTQYMHLFLFLGVLCNFVRFIQCDFYFLPCL